MKQTYVVLSLISAFSLFSSAAQAQQQTTPGYPLPKTPDVVTPAQPPAVVTPAQQTTPGYPAPQTPPVVVTPQQPPVAIIPAQPPAIVTPVQPPAVVVTPQQPGVVVVPQILVGNAAEMPLIYAAMMSTRRLANGAGHTVAASVLVNCLPGLTPVQKAQTLMEMVGALSRSNLRVVNEAFREDICDNAQVTIIAAVLACKMGIRTPAMMVQTLSGGYREVLNRFRYINELYQVEVAARLIQ